MLPLHTESSGGMGRGSRGSKAPLNARYYNIFLRLFRHRPVLAAMLTCAFSFACFALVASWLGVGAAILAPWTSRSAYLQASAVGLSPGETPCRLTLERGAVRMPERLTGAPDEVQRITGETLKTVEDARAAAEDANARIRADLAEADELNAMAAEAAAAREAAAEWARQEAAAAQARAEDELAAEEAAKSAAAAEAAAAEQAAAEQAAAEQAAAEAAATEAAAAEQAATEAAATEQAAAAQAAAQAAADQVADDQASADQTSGDADTVEAGQKADDADDATPQPDSVPAVDDEKNVESTAADPDQALRRRLSAPDINQPRGGLVVASGDGVASALKSTAGKSSPPPRRFPRQVNKLADSTDWKSGEDLEEWLSIFDSLGVSFARNEIHRHEWEWAQGIYAMKKLGLLNPSKTALGIGCGTSPVMYYLANNVQHVTATDVYKRATPAAGAAFGAPPMPTFIAKVLSDPTRFAPFEYKQDALTVQDMSATDLQYDDESFDIVWAFSTIEDISGHVAAATAVREMARVVKPGGAVVITTQLVINGVAHYKGVQGLFRRDWFLPDELEEHIIVPALELGLELMEEVDLSVSDEDLAQVLSIDNYDKCVSVKPHVILHQAGSVWTSVALVFTKPLQPGEPVM